jgi:hypothetical protein
VTAPRVRPVVDACLRGEGINGDDFTGPELTRWYEDETSAYGNIFAARAVVLGDDLLCRLTESRLTYHATTPVQKLRPTNMFLVLRVHPSPSPDRAS